MTQKKLSIIKLISNEYGVEKSTKYEENALVRDPFFLIYFWDQNNNKMKIVYVFPIQKS